MHRNTLLIGLLLFMVSMDIHGQEVDQKALVKLRNRATECHTSGLLVYAKNRLIINEHFATNSRAIDAMSATKSIVNLGIGKLITDGLLESIDEPVATFYPEWRQGAKKEITIRHLLNHTSGLQSERMTTEIYAAPDFVQLALCAEVSNAPGAKFFYNNKAVNLLAGVIEKASGKRMDNYIKETIFDPLGLKDYFWLTDSFLFHLNTTGKQDTSYLRKGNPIGMAELFITPWELAKIGLLVLNKGKIDDRQIINESWFVESFKAGQSFDPTCGLLWWLIYDPETSYITFQDNEIKKLKAIGIDQSVIQDLLKIKGTYKSPLDLSLKLDGLPSIQKMGGRAQFRSLLFSKGFYDNIYEWHATHVVGISAKGTYGQYLTIFPDKKIVAVRMIDSESYTSSVDDFSDFDYLVYELVK